MENESDIIESLNAIGYRGECLKKNVLAEALAKGAASPSFRALIAWIVYELHVLRKTDEIIHDDGDKNSFTLELSALLTELGCPFQKFVTGPYSCRFPTKQLKIQLLEYLITELMTTKMCLKQKPVVGDSYIIPKFETNTARALESITNDLGMTKPPENISPRALFDKLNFKLEEAKRGSNKLIVGDSLLNSETPLSEEQWKKLEEIQKTLDDEYNLRRQVLLTRLEVTVQSFQWTDRIKGSETLIANQYQAKLKELDKCRYGGTDTDIVALLAARSDLAVIEKTSSAQVRKNTGTKIQKHVIGSVPDRGGRANEHAPPPPEMPSWQTQRSAGPARGGFGGGDRGGYRGGRGGRGGGGGGGGNRGDSGNSRGGGGNWNNNSGGGNYQSNQNQGGGGGGGGGGGNNNWLSGSGRVQGSGWQPKQSFNDMQSNISNNQYGDNRSGRGEYSGNPDGYNPYGGQQQQQQQKQQQNSQRSGGGSNYNRGRSNYYRGGGGGSGNYRQN